MTRPEPSGLAAYVRYHAAEMRLTLTACTVDLARSEVERDGEVLRLTPTECAMLLWFLERPGQAVTTEQLQQEVWGYRPGVESRAVANAVARLRRKIEADPREPDHLKTVFGTGYLFEAPSQASTATVDVPTLAPLPAVRGRSNLHRQFASIVGRSDECAALEALVATGGAAIVSGGVGIGKSGLAWRWCAEQTDADEVWWCDLEHARTAAEAALRVALTLDLPGDDVLERVGPALAARGTVALVLDGADAVPEVEAWARAWSEAAPRARVVLTLRTPSSELPQVALGPLDGERATRLLLRRIKRVHWGFAPDEAQLAQLHVVATEAAGGHPLAIELVALAAVDHPVDVRLDQGLGAVVRWALDRLDDDARTLIERTAPLADGFRTDAAEALCPGIDGEQVLQALHTAGLVETRLTHARTLRHRLPRAVAAATGMPPLTVAGVQHVADAGEALRARVRAGAPGAVVTAAVPTLDRALEAALAHEAAELAVRLGATLDRALAWPPHASAAAVALRAAEEAGADGTGLLERTRALCAAHEGALDQVGPPAREALEAARLAGDGEAAADVRWILGVAAARAADPERARTHLEAIRDRPDEADPATLVRALRRLAELCPRTEALRLLQEATGVAERLGAAGAALAVVDDALRHYREANLVAMARSWSGRRRRLAERLGGDVADDDPLAAAPAWPGAPLVSATATPSAPRSSGGAQALIRLALDRGEARREDDDPAGAAAVYEITARALLDLDPEALPGPARAGLERALEVIRAVRAPADRARVLAAALRAATDG